MRRLVRGLELVAVIVALLVHTLVGAQPAERPAVHVRHGQLVDAHDAPLRLFGVNRSGTEYACVVDDGVGAGIFGGPSDDASIAAMKTWRVNAVRVSLNESCWLGINGVKRAYGGTAYRSAIVDYVHRLNYAGLVAIIDLHWNAPGTTLATGQQVMADADHAPEFWRSVAATFSEDPGVMFDLYNEPRDVGWQCWRRGCTTPDGWETVGMQALVDVVRQTGAKQPIVLSGLHHANDLSAWAAHPIRDPLDQLVAGFHLYDGLGEGSCATPRCWNEVLAPLAKHVPIITTELGERDGRSDLVSAYARWADSQWHRGRSVSIMAWAWDAAQGEGGPSLIASFDGSPTPYGRAFRAYLDRLAARDAIHQW